MRVVMVLMALLLACVSSPPVSKSPIALSGPLYCFVGVFKDPKPVTGTSVMRGCSPSWRVCNTGLATAKRFGTFAGVIKLTKCHLLEPQVESN